MNTGIGDGVLHRRSLGYWLACMEMGLELLPEGGILEVGVDGGTYMEAGLPYLIEERIVITEMKNEIESF